MGASEGRRLPVRGRAFRCAGPAGLDGGRFRPRGKRRRRRKVLLGTEAEAPPPGGPRPREPGERSRGLGAAAVSLVKSIRTFQYLETVLPLKATLRNVNSLIRNSKRMSMSLGHHWTAFGVIKYLGLYLAVTAYFLAFSLQSSVMFEMST